jgi:plasmid maintenance system killer protein
MELYFRASRLRDDCADPRRATRRWGQQNARRLQARLADLAAAERLADLSPLPPTRCHPLRGERAGQFAIDLHGLTRLIFEPLDDPPPRLPDGGVDLTQITAIRILEITDYHG